MNRSEEAFGVIRAALEREMPPMEDRDRDTVDFLDPERHARIAVDALAEAGLLDEST